MITSTKLVTCGMWEMTVLHPLNDDTKHPGTANNSSRLHFTRRLVAETTGAVSLRFLPRAEALGFKRAWLFKLLE